MKQVNIKESIFFFAIVTAPLLHAKQVQLSFDSPFPSTWFKKALDSCMQVWNDMQLCQECNQQIAPEDHQLLLEATVGRLAYAHFCLEHLAKTKDDIIPDDIAYLMQVVEHIQQLSNREKKSTNERLLCMKKISEQLKLFLTKMVASQG